MSAAQSYLHTLVKQKLSRLLLALVVIVMTSPMYAQIVETGIITGVVKDNTGAVIPSAHVNIRNDGTGLASSTTTNDQGIYVTPPLNPGDYSVAIEVPGFSKVVEKVRLEVGQRVAADATLAVGTNAETIEVQATGTVLQTESSSVGNLRTEEAVKSLPLNGRNFAELLGLGAGVVPAQTQVSSVAYTQQRGVVTYSFNGLSSTNNRVLLDGIGDNENHNGLGVVIYPPVDAIQEFSEQTSDADARYGRSGGGTVNLIYKSGTDKYHGDVFEFLRNTSLNAKNYFATGPKPPLRQNEFGVTFGGPLFYKQKNPKTFFFADYSGQRLTYGLTSVDTVPDFKLTSAGYDFSDYTAATINNPATKAVYTTKIIPVSDVNATGAKILNFYHQYASPNIAGKTTAANYLYNPVKTLIEDAFDVKVDHRFSELDSGFLRYSQSRDSLSQPGSLPVPLVGAVISGPSESPAHQAVLSETHIFSPTRVNTARYGWSRYFAIVKNWNAGKDLPTQLSIPGVIVPGDPNSDGLPVYSFSGGTSIGDAANSPTQIGTNNYQWDDNVNLVHGKHSLDVGIEVVRLQYNMFQTAAEHGSESFGTKYSGLAWTDLLFGTPQSGSYQYQSGTRGFRQTQLSFYVQDNFKVASRLTLNLGVRYDNYLGWPWTEVNDKMYSFDPSISTTTVEKVGTQGVPRSGIFGNNTNFAPRVGFAYEILPKTVFHSGFGLFYSAPNISNSSGLSMNAPGLDYWAFSNSGTYGAAASSGAAFVNTSDGFVHTVVTSTSALPKGLPLQAVDSHARTPYSEQWHASIERELPLSTVLTVAYVGTRGVHLNGLVDINTNPDGTTNITANRPYPYFIQINQLQTNLVSIYNSLQISAERRARNFSFLGSYSYSHALDETYSTQPHNVHADYGNSDLNIPNRVVASATYHLPFKGNGKIGELERGWQVNAIAQFFDGLPFSVSSGNGVGDSITPRAFLKSGYGNGSLPSGKRTLAKWYNTDAFSPTNPDTLAPAGQWGNSGRNILQGPGTKTVDFSLFKDTHLTESKVLQLRAEVFNIFNTPQFNNPAATAGSTSAGIVSSAGSDTTYQRTARQIQLAAKITF
jgi:hypothetical protein